MITSTHVNLAAAVGAWVAGEMVAAMARPSEMLSPDGFPTNLKQFNGCAFEDHLAGMLSDVIDCCGAGLDPAKPVQLHIAAEHPGSVEAQGCLQGYAYFTQEV